MAADPRRRRAGRMVAAASACLLAVTACTGGGGDRSGGPADEEGSAATADTELAAEAYVAGYPLVATVRIMNNLAGGIGVNQLFVRYRRAGPEDRMIPAPIRDALYSAAVLDLRSEPMALTLPQIDDRYYAFQFLDAWMDTLGYVGTRATGGRAGTWVVTPPGWDGELPEGVERIEATTPQVFVLGRFHVVDDADIANVAAIREQISLQPLSALTGDPAAPEPPPLDSPAGTLRNVPTSARFFDQLGDALAVNPPTTPARREVFERARALGIGPGEQPVADTVDVDSDERRERLAPLNEGAALGFERIADAERPGDVVNGWSVHFEHGDWGDDMLDWARATRVGWGANEPAEALYPVARVDADGAALDGESTYRIRFPPGEEPPVEAFWSLSAYGDDGFFVAHPSGRYTIGDHTPGLAFGDDGSLEILLSHDEPSTGPDGQPANWLPVPAGPFLLVLRLYVPGQEVLDGDYLYPSVERL